MAENMRVARGKVHRVAEKEDVGDGAFVYTYGCGIMYLNMKPPPPSGPDTPTDDPVTCKNCLRGVGGDG